MRLYVDLIINGGYRGISARFPSPFEDLSPKISNENPELEDLVRTCLDPAASILIQTGARPLATQPTYLRGSGARLDLYAMSLPPL